MLPPATMIKLINYYLAFFIFLFNMTMPLQLGVNVSNSCIRPIGRGGGGGHPHLLMGCKGLFNRRVRTKMTLRMQEMWTSTT